MGLQKFVLIWMFLRFICWELDQKNLALELKKKNETIYKFDGLDSMQILTILKDNIPVSC